MIKVEIMEAAKKDRQDKKRVLTTRINALNRYVAENRDVDHVKVKVEELKESSTSMRLRMNIIKKR